MAQGITEKFEACCDALQLRLEQSSSRFIIFALLFPCLLASFLTNLGADPDLFARIAVGRLIAIYGRVIDVDPFAYTKTHPIWYDHEWFAGLVFYWSSQLAGDLGLFLLKVAFCLSSLYFLLLAQETQTRKTLRSVLWLAICIVGSSFVWNNNIRAQVFTFLFYPAILFCFGAFEKKQQLIMLLSVPMIFIIWTNSHGGFVVGIAAAAFLTLSHIQKKTFPVAVICFFLSLLALLCNPYGWGYLKYIINAVLMPRGHIDEWAPPALFSARTAILSFAIVVVAFGFYKRQIRKDPGIMVLLLFCAYLALAHDRLLPFFLMTTAVYCTDAFSALLDAVQATSKRYYLLFARTLTFLAVLLPCLALFFILGSILSTPRFSLSYERYPVKALEWLRTNRDGGKVLVDFTNGSYALWRLYPKFRISLDGRYEEVYPDSTVKDVFRAFDINRPDQIYFLEKVWPDFILLTSDSSAFHLREHFGKQWQPIYTDPDYSLLALKPNPDGSVVTNPPLEIRNIWDPLF